MAMLVYVWSRRSPRVRVNFFGLLTFQAPFLPWALMGFSLLLGNSILVDLLGEPALSYLPTSGSLLPSGHAAGSPGLPASQKSLLAHKICIFRANLQVLEWFLLGVGQSFCFKDPTPPVFSGPPLPRPYLLLRRKEGCLNLIPHPTLAGSLCRTLEYSCLEPGLWRVASSSV
jgi:hypothetical protein